MLKRIACEIPKPTLYFNDGFMPIPPLQYDGFLPPGPHLTEMDEIEDRFSKTQRSCEGKINIIQTQEGLLLSHEQLAKLRAWEKEIINDPGQPSRIKRP